MAKKIYVGVSNLAQNVNKIYVGVNGTARKIVKGYVGVNDIAQPFWGSSFPSGYTQLKYIESTGTQYIDTGVSGTGIGSYEMKVRTTGGDSNSWSQFFAGDKNPYTAKLYRNSGSVRLAWSGSGVNPWTYPDSTNDHVLEVKAPNVLVDNTIVSSSYAGYVWGTFSYYIFNAHQESSLCGKMRLYYLKMWTDGVLVRDFIPAKRESDNAVGLLDIANNVFYTNAGRGTFLYEELSASRLLMNSGSLVGMGDRAEITLEKEEQPEEITETKSTEVDKLESEEGSGDSR